MAADDYASIIQDITENIQDLEIDGKLFDIVFFSKQGEYFLPDKTTSGMNLNEFSFLLTVTVSPK